MIKKVVGASLIGTTVEWYDFFLYGSAAALVFNKLFFPTADPLTGTLLAFTTYAIGFLARPLGGVVFGHFGDRLGRKKLLVLSLLLRKRTQIFVVAPKLRARQRFRGFGIEGLPPAGMRRAEDGSHVAARRQRDAH